MTHIARGLLKGDTVDKETGDVLWPAFISKKPEPPREDGGREASIDWGEPPSVVDQLMRLRAISEHGVATVEVGNLEHLDRYKPHAFVERRPVEGNDAHGNVVYLPSCTGPKERTIAGYLAAMATYHARP